MRPAWMVAVVMGAGLAPASVASAQTPTAAIGFLQISPFEVGNNGTVTIVPSDPCPPPAAATAPFVVVTDSGPDVAPHPQRLASVPVASDGRWTATVPLAGTGGHALQAYCLSGPQAEGAYDFYEATFEDVLPRSVGFWAASPNRQDAAVAGDAPDEAVLVPGRLATPAAPVVGAAAEPRFGLGYWTVGRDGGVYSFGRTDFWGSAADIHLAAPVVGMAVTPSGRGYWLAAADGGVFTYGDARYYGSGAGDMDTSPVVGIARTGLASALGYLLAHADGKVVEYTAAGVAELNAPLRLAAPIVGIASTPSERGYWLAAADGGVFSFGDAAFGGSLGSIRLAAPITGITSRFDGGYWLIARDGGVFSFGGAPFVGSFTSSGRSFVAIAASPDPTAGTG